MASYTAPDVYLQDVKAGSATIEQASATVGVMIGKTRNGVIGTPVRIGSWTEFIENFAIGLDTPFDANSYLPYAVQGFYQNGGKELYVIRLLNSGVKATKAGTTYTITAKTGGTWANGMVVKATKGAEWTSSNLVFDFTIILDSLTVTIKDCYADTFVSKIMADETAKQLLDSITFSSSVTALAEETVTLEAGTEGTTLGDTDYVNALTLLDNLDDVTFVAIPGQTSSTVNSGILSYCENNGLYPILSTAIGTTVANAKTLRQSTTSWAGSLLYPWIKVNDPLNDGNLKTIPPVGHYMGAYARTIMNAGIGQVPAGISYGVLRGVVELETVLTQADISLLNPIGVICIISRTNAGIVVWGARSLNSADPLMKYVSDGLLNLNIKKSIYDGTQWAVFEPNNEALRKRVRTACLGLLDTYRADGALVGEGEGTSYIVICDDSNNTQATINNGQIIIDVGYAPVKPAEFVIFRIAHSIETV